MINRKYYPLVGGILGYAAVWLSLQLSGLETALMFAGAIGGVGAGGALMVHKAHDNLADTLDRDGLLQRELERRRHEKDAE
jgi:hypothetical protein